MQIVGAEECKLKNKLVEECSENIDEVKMTEITLAEDES